MICQRSAKVLIFRPLVIIDYADNSASRDLKQKNRPKVITEAQENDSNVEKTGEMHFQIIALGGCDATFYWNL